MKHTQKKIDLIIELALTNFKLKNEGSYLGILWYLIEPLITFLIFLTIRNVVGRGIDNYAIYLFTGLIMFNFFRQTTKSCVRAIASRQGLIKSIKTDKNAFVYSSVLSSAFTHFFEFIVYAIISVFFGIPITNLFIYPFIFILLFLFTLGVSFLVATIGAYFNDFNNIWSVLTRLLWFATPVFYSAKINLPFNFNIFNPMYYFITIARELIVYSTIPDSQLIVISVIFAFSSFIIGRLIFNKTKKKFAEII